MWDTIRQIIAGGWETLKAWVAALVAAGAAAVVSWLAEDPALSEVLVWEHWLAAFFAGVVARVATWTVPNLPPSMPEPSPPEG